MKYCITKVMFCKVFYKHEQNGQEYPEYLMNRDGFSLLVMGFTGKDVADVLKYQNGSRDINHKQGYSDEAIERMCNELRNS